MEMQEILILNAFSKIILLLEEAAEIVKRESFHLGGAEAVDDQRREWIDEEEQKDSKNDNLDPEPEIGIEGRAALLIPAQHERTSSLLFL